MPIDDILVGSFTTGSSVEDLDCRLYIVGDHRNPIQFTVRLPCVALY